MPFRSLNFLPFYKTQFKWKVSTQSVLLKDNVSPHSLGGLNRQTGSSVVKRNFPIPKRNPTVWGHASSFAVAKTYLPVSIRHELSQWGAHKIIDQKTKDSIHKQFFFFLSTKEKIQYAEIKKKIKTKKFNKTWKEIEWNEKRTEEKDWQHKRNTYIFMTILNESIFLTLDTVLIVLDILSKFNVKIVCFPGTLILYIFMV